MGMSGDEHDGDRVLMFSVLGTPRPKPSVRRGAGNVWTLRQKHDVNVWRDAVTRAARSAVEVLVRGGQRMEWLFEAVEVEREYRFSPPSRRIHMVGRAHGVKPDADNLDKLLLDAMQDGGVLLGGDQRVALGVVRKVWARQAGVWVVIRPAGVGVVSVEDLRGPGLFDDAAVAE